MTWLGKSKSLKYLGTLHGRGRLSAVNGGNDLGLVVYEIDGYIDRVRRSADGRIEGDIETLTRAFEAGPVSIALEGGLSIEIELTNPCGGATAEVRVIGPFPL